MRNCSISLDDKWTVTQGRVMMNGTQALARVMLAQAWLDKRDGLDTSGYISGYRGSPLGNVDTTLWSSGKHLAASRVRFYPADNEDLAATASAGPHHNGHERQSVWVDRRETYGDDLGCFGV